jgi:hypothetical protein
MAIPRRSHQDGELGEVEQGVWTGEGDAVVGADRVGQATVAEQLFEGGAGKVLAGGVECLAQQQETRGVVGNGEWVAVPPIAELELALEVGAPEGIGAGAFGQRRAARAMARPAAALDQAVPVENRVDGAFGRDPDIAIEPPDEEFADLAGSPMGLFGLQADNQAFELLRQLVGVAHRPPRTVAQGLEPVLPISVEDLVAGFARDAEDPADLRHRLTIEKLCDKPQALVHDRTLLPRHPHLPPTKSEKCNPCVRYVLSPMSRAAHIHSLACTFRPSR